MKKLPHYLFLFLFTGIFFSLSAQSPFGLEKPSGFYEMQAAFEKWADGRDLSQEKGWKPYQRWAYHWESRIRPDGSLPDPTWHLKAAQQYQRLRGNTSSRGSAWSPVGPFGYPEPQDTILTSGVGRVNCVTFHPTDPNTLWIGTPGGGVWKSTDNGGSWMPINNGLPILSISEISINPQNPDEMYVATGDFDYFTSFLITLGPSGNHVATVGGYGIYKSIDGGQNWTVTGYNFTLPVERGAMIRRILVHPQHPDTLLAGGLDGVWRSEDAGANWTKVYNQIITDLEFHDSNPNKVFAASSWHWDVSSRAGIHVSTDFGDNWATIYTPIPAEDTVTRVEIAIAPTDSNYMYAVATSFFGRGLHGFYKSTNAGQSWTTMVMGDTLNLLGWYYDCDTDKFYGGQGNYDLSLLVDHRNKEKVCIGGILNFASEDGGSSWGFLSEYTDEFGKTIHPDHHQARSNPLTDQYYFCHDGGIDRADTLKPLLISDFKSCYFWANCDPKPFCNLSLQTEWTNISDGLVNTEFYRIGLRESTREIIGGTQDNSTFAFSFGRWRQVAILSDGMEAMMFPNSGDHIYATSQYGYLRLSTNGGYSFTPSLVDTIMDVESTGQWVTPYLMHPTDPNTIYAGFRNVWKSTDRGTNWAKISQFPAEPTFNSPLPKAIRDMEINPNMPDNIWVIKRPYLESNLAAEVHVTFTGAAFWRDCSAGLPVDSLFANDLAIGNKLGDAWICFGGFLDNQKVYFTKDAGLTWENHSYNLPNIPINAIEYDPTSANNTVYIGTDVGIWYIHDGLTEWQLYSDELPLVMINELEIDKMHSKIYAATFGRGVWVADLVQDNVSIDPPAIYQADVKLYPNPNTGSFSLTIQQSQMQETQLEIVDITGRIVYQEKLMLDNQQQTYTINRKLKPGHYFVKLTHDNRSKVIKMIVH